MSRILIVGLGYVGRALARELLKSGHEVRGVTRRSGGDEGVPIVPADVAETGSLGQLPSSADAMVYLVSPDARDQGAYRRCYVEGLRNVLGVVEAEHVLLVTSTAVYGQNNGECVDEDSETRPADYRGETMLESEALLASVPGRATAIRFSGIYGPGRDRLVRRVKDGSAQCSDPPRYTNRIHRDDCAGLLAHLIRNRPEHSLYLGSDDEPAAECEVLDWIALRLERPLPERVANERGANKRIRNARVRASGYDFRYPGYRDGYAELLAGK